MSRILYVNGGWSQGEKRRGCRGLVEAVSRPHIEVDVEARRRGHRGQGSVPLREPPSPILSPVATAGFKVLTSSLARPTLPSASKLSSIVFLNVVMRYRFRRLSLLGILPITILHVHVQTVLSMALHRHLGCPMPTPGQSTFPKTVAVRDGPAPASTCLIRGEPAPVRSRSRARPPSSRIYAVPHTPDSRVPLN